MVEPEGADEGSFSPMVVPFTIGLVTALTPFWRCRESDQRSSNPQPSGVSLVMDPLVVPIAGLILVVAQIIYGDTTQSQG